MNPKRREALALFSLYETWASLINSLPVLLPVHSQFWSQFQIYLNRTPSQPKRLIALY